LRDVATAGEIIVATDPNPWKRAELATRILLSSDPTPAEQARAN